MSVSGIGATPVFQVPVTPQAQLSDEQHESSAVKSREATTGKDAAAPVQQSTSSVDIKA